jgi:hypothetical protein
MAGSAGVVERIGTSKEGRHSLEEEEGETGGITIEGDGGRRRSLCRRRQGQMRHLARLCERQWSSGRPRHQKWRKRRPHTVCSGKVVVDTVKLAMERWPPYRWQIVKYPLVGE